VGASIHAVRVPRRGVAVLLTVLVVGSVVGVPLSSQPTAAQSSEPPGVIPDGQKFNASTNVDVWERSILTTRAEFDGSATEVPIGSLQARLEPVSGDVGVRTGEVGVVGADQQISVTFDQSGASSSLVEGEPGELVVARLGRSGEVPTTFEGLIDTLNESNANQNATFVREEDFTFDGSGTKEITFDQGPGQYVVFFNVKNKTGDTGLEISNGDISANSDVTVVGFDQITVQREPATVASPASAEPGDEITFQVDSSEAFAGSSDVTHVLMVYNDDTFDDPSQSRFTLVTDEADVDRNFNLSNSTLEHTIGETTGVAEVEDGVSVNNIDLSDGRVSRTVALGAVVDFVAEDLQGNPPRTKREGNTELFASMRGVAKTGPRRTISVETFGNWSSGTYRYLYVGTLESNGSAVSTDTGTIEIQKPAASDNTSVQRGAESAALNVDGTVGNVNFEFADGASVAQQAEVSEFSSRPAGPAPSTSNNLFLSIDAPTSMGGTRR
jgi:hypothetical protein